MDGSSFSNIKTAMGLYQPDSTNGLSMPDNTNGLCTPSVTSSDGTLSPSQQVDNYDFFSKEIMGKGVYLPDLMKQVESLKAEVESLKANAKAEVDTELFEVMESKVRDAPAVVDARKAMEGMRETVLDEMCRNDPRYRDAVAAYRKAVADAYRKQE